MGILRRVCLAILFLVGSSFLTAIGAEEAEASNAYRAPDLLTASIYSRDRKEVSFTFKRVVERSGETQRVERTFNYASGKPAARERVVYDRKGLVCYELEELQWGGSGSVTVRPSPKDPAKNEIEFRYLKEPGAKPKVRTEALRENTLIADTVGMFLVSQWDAIARGEKVKCRFIVLQRTETVGFTFSKESPSAREGTPVLMVKMEPSSHLLSALVDPILFTVEANPPHRVLEYTGRTTPKVQVGGKWKDWDAVTVFDWPAAK